MRDEKNSRVFQARIEDTQSIKKCKNKNGPLKNQYTYTEVIIDFISHLRTKNSGVKDEQRPYSNLARSGYSARNLPLFIFSQ